MKAIKVIAKNKKAYFNYEIVESIEAGVVLLGMEVKSIKGGQVNISDAFIRIEEEKALLWNAHISAYKYSSIQKYDPIRSREILISKRQRGHFLSEMKSKRLTAVPLKIYLSRGFVKLEIALVKGRKKYDKRERERERDITRESAREKRTYMVK